MAVIHFKYSSVYMSIPNSLTIPSSVQFSSVTQLCPTLQPHGLTAAGQAPLSMEFSRQE